MRQTALKAPRRCQILIADQPVYGRGNDGNELLCNQTAEDIVPWVRALEKGAPGRHNGTAHQSDSLVAQGRTSAFPLKIKVGSISPNKNTNTTPMHYPLGYGYSASPER